MKTDLIFKSLLFCKAVFLGTSQNLAFVQSYVFWINPINAVIQRRHTEFGWVKKVNYEYIERVAE